MASLPYPQRQSQLQGLLHKLGLPDRAPVQLPLVDRALTHPSISVGENYEQLEFLGDAVVRMATAEFLWNTYPDLPVGEYAAIRSILVSDRTLATIAGSYGLDRYLLVSEAAAGDRTGQETRMAEAFEALLGALYLSTHTLELVHPWLEPHLHRLTREILADPARQNYKAALQEWSQGQYKTLPEYRVQEQGSPGDGERFAAEVWLRGERLGTGMGRSIKLAEQAAAQAAFWAVVRQESGGNDQKPTR